MPDEVHNRRSDDHDLLIRLDEKVEVLIKSVDNLTNDHERRLRFIERYVWGALGILALVQLLGVAYVISVVQHH